MLVLLVGGSFSRDLLVAMALSVSLRAFDDHLRLPVLIVVISLAAMIGGRRHRRGLHPAPVLFLPAAHLGLGHPGLDAEEGVSVSPCPAGRRETLT